MMFGKLIPDSLSFYFGLWGFQLGEMFWNYRLYSKSWRSSTQTHWWCTFLLLSCSSALWHPSTVRRGWTYVRLGLQFAAAVQRVCLFWTGLHRNLSHTVATWGMWEILFYVLQMEDLKWNDEDIKINLPFCCQQFRPNPILIQINGEPVMIWVAVKSDYNAVSLTYFSSAGWRQGLGWLCSWHCWLE